MIHRIDRHIGKLVDLELKQTRDEFEEYFNSQHEGYSIILEELTEVEIEFKHLSISNEFLWHNVMDNYVDMPLLYDMLRNSERLASEAIQTTAMIKKFIETAEKKEWE